MNVWYCLASHRSVLNSDVEVRASKDLLEHALDLLGALEERPHLFLCEVLYLLDYSSRTYQDVAWDYRLQVDHSKHIILLQEYLRLFYVN